MASRTVDVVAAGPASSDPYDPAAPAWALAAALAAGGDSVAVLHPDGPAGTPPPAGLTDVPVDVPVRRPGAAVESAGYASAAARRIRPTAELVLRDPAGLGRLGLRRAAGRGPVLAGFVHEVELTVYDRERGSRSPTGVRDRLDHWLDRRSVRRLEAASLGEADRLFYDAPGAPAEVSRAYGIPDRKFRAAMPAVAGPPELPSREESRASFRVPADVPVVALLAPSDRPEPAGADLAREAFRRVRSFFPGARLVVAGASVPADSGVAVAPSRDLATFSRAISAADVVVAPRRTPGFDPGLVLALRAGRASIVGPAVRFPLDPAGAVRAVPTDDPGEFASVLAELLADPAARRELGLAAARYAAPFDPERVRDVVLAATAVGGG